MSVSSWRGRRRRSADDVGRGRQTGVVADGAAAVQLAEIVHQGAFHRGRGRETSGHAVLLLYRRRQCRTKRSLAYSLTLVKLLCANMNYGVGIAKKALC